MSGRRDGRQRTDRRHPRLSTAATPRLGRFLYLVFSKTTMAYVLASFVALWLLFAAGIYFAERDTDGSQIQTFGQALYWSVAAFSTAGIADTPQSPLALLIGAIWIVLGSVIFFGMIVATVTGYFMRPLQRPVNQIVDTIEYNLEHLDDLSVEELALLKKTTDSLIVHMERQKQRSEAGEDAHT